MRCMSMLAAGAAGLLLSACERPEVRTVTVQVTGKAAAPADSFELAVILFAEAESREEASQTMQSLVASYQETLSAMEGMTHFRFETVDFGLGEACLDEDRRYGIQAGCSNSVFTANQTLRINARPAQAAGNMASLSYELGAENVEVVRYYLNDGGPLQQEATRDAVAKARSEAELLAEAMGARLGDVQSAVPQRLNQAYAELNSPDDSIVVTAMRATRPGVAMDVTPGLVEVETRLGVTYELVGAEPGAPEGS